jgi:hypothetical protein
MVETGSVIARRIAFLERELDRMGRLADDAEHDLRANPADAEARRTLEAVYALSGETWSRICELRARQGDAAAIRFDRPADASAQRAFRQALV